MTDHELGCSPSLVSPRPFLMDWSDREARVIGWDDSNGAIYRTDGKGGAFYYVGAHGRQESFLRTDRIEQRRNKRKARIAQQHADNRAVRRAVRRAERTVGFFPPSALMLDSIFGNSIDD